MTKIVFKLASLQIHKFHQQSQINLFTLGEKEKLRERATRYWKSV